MNSLLPINATPFELRLSETLATAFLELDPDIIRGLKFSHPDGFLDALIWEYGLGEISQFIPNKSELIREGLKWQRIRGTSASLKMALGWIGVRADILESPPSIELNADLAGLATKPQQHFAEYDLIPETLPTSEQMCLIFALALLSQPVRARLWRLVYGYDRRVFRLGASQLDDHFLDDDSGMRPTKEQLPCFHRHENHAAPKLSFLQTYAASARWFPASIDTAITQNHAVRIASWQANMPFLDDQPEEYEIRRTNMGSAEPLAPAIYFGQMWAAQPWTENSWQKTRTIVSQAHITTGGN